MLVSSTKLNHATKLFLKKQIYISSLPVNANDVASSLTLSSCEEWLSQSDGEVDSVRS